ncbi:hypothetical protein HK099_003188 [Clydaea vesicula]|uniref:FHA domain-containing protein n=1 Tax=Clydaea vesicula TaxID=447962 RepID=A0AAD5U2A7_9FUNG|nr:hypothetical protein HK099_003188 [Clydaea vesicula]
MAALFKLFFVRPNGTSVGSYDFSAKNPVSLNHVKIEMSAKTGYAHITNLSSSVGTLLNNTSLEVKTLLKNEDVFSLSGKNFRFEYTIESLEMQSKTKNPLTSTNTKKRKYHFDLVSSPKRLRSASRIKPTLVEVDKENTCPLPIQKSSGEKRNVRGKKKVHFSRYVEVKVFHSATLEDLSPTEVYRKSLKQTTLVELAPPITQKNSKKRKLVKEGREPAKDVLVATKAGLKRGRSQVKVDVKERTNTKVEQQRSEELKKVSTGTESCFSVNGRVLRKRK